MSMSIPGDLLHIDTKKLGRIERMGKRIPGSSHDAGRRRLGILVRRRRRPRRIGFTDLYPDETQSQRRAVPAKHRRLLPIPGRATSSASSPTTALRSAPKHSPETCRDLKLKHSFTRRLPAADQRQSRTLHPIGAARMGLRHRLQPFIGAHSDARALDSPLQLASPASRHQRHGTDQSLSSVPKQPVDASQLVTLIHNPGAGDQDEDGESLRKLLRDAGHEVRYQSAKEDGWKGALKKTADLIVIAGGDGTVGRVVRRVAGRGIPIGCCLLEPPTTLHARWSRSAAVRGAGPRLGKARRTSSTWAWQKDRGASAISSRASVSAFSPACLQASRPTEARQEIPIRKQRRQGR